MNTIIPTPEALIRKPYLVDARSGGAPNPDGTSQGGGSREVVTLIDDNFCHAIAFQGADETPADEYDEEQS
ncbi:MAG: hypothetical protein HRT82_16735 [Henriciella sp.]|nr:hypothetical protein [Henriciella sp.]